MPLIINGERVEDAEIQQEAQSVMAAQQDEPQPLTFENQDELAEYAKENVICRVLLRQEAAERIQSVSPKDVKAAFDELTSQAGGEKQFYEAHNIDKSQRPEIEKNLRHNLRVQRLLDEITSDVPGPGDEQIQAYFEENADEFVNPEQVHLSHIVKHPGRGASPEEMFEEMKAVRKKLLAGGDFVELSRKHSHCTDDDGDLGFFAPGQMVEEFEAVAFSLEVGEISPVFLTQFGYHIAKLHERRPSSPQPLEEVKDEIREHLEYEMKNDRVGEFVEQLKQQATIAEIPDSPPEIRPEDLKPAKPAAKKAKKNKKTKKTRKRKKRKK